MTAVLVVDGHDGGNENCIGMVLQWVMVIARSFW